MNQPASSTSTNEKARWMPLWLIMAGVGGWGLYHAIGALRSDEDWKVGLIKALIIFACVGGFLAFWAIALTYRARQSRASLLAEAGDGEDLGGTSGSEATEPGSTEHN